MKILIGCEYSGVVRDSFLRLNRKHDVVSCDILPSEKHGAHIQDDILNHLNENWNMLIAFPPCTHLCVSGARWFKDKEFEQKEGINFFMQMVNAPIEKICIENPIGIMSTSYRKPDQYIQPYQFGHGETKKTCLWLKNLPLLKPTNIVSGRINRIHNMSPSPTRGKIRSLTYTGIAHAMAEQWG